MFLLHLVDCLDKILIRSLISWNSSSYWTGTVFDYIPMFYIVIKFTGLNNFVNSVDAFLTDTMWSSANKTRSRQLTYNRMSPTNYYAAMTVSLLSKFIAFTSLSYTIASDGYYFCHAIDRIFSSNVRVLVGIFSTLKCCPRLFGR